MHNFPITYTTTGYYSQANGMRVFLQVFLNSRASLRRVMAFCGQLATLRAARPLATLEMPLVPPKRRSPRLSKFIPQRPSLLSLLPSLSLTPFSLTWQWPVAIKEHQCLLNCGNSCGAASFHLSYSVFSFVIGILKNICLVHLGSSIDGLLV